MNTSDLGSTRSAAIESDDAIYQGILVPAERGLRCNWRIEVSEADGHAQLLTEACAPAAAALQACGERADFSMRWPLEAASVAAALFVNAFGLQTVDDVSAWLHAHPGTDLEEVFARYRAIVIAALPHHNEWRMRRADVRKDIEALAGVPGAHLDVLKDYITLRAKAQYVIPRLVVTACPGGHLVVEGSDRPVDLTLMQPIHEPGEVELAVPMDVLASDLAVAEFRDDVEWVRVQKAAPVPVHTESRAKDAMEHPVGDAMREAAMVQWRLDTEQKMPPSFKPW